MFIPVLSQYTTHTTLNYPYNVHMNCGNEHANNKL